MNTNEMTQEELIQKLQEIFDHVSEKFIPEDAQWEFITRDNREDYIKELLDQRKSVGKSFYLDQTITEMASFQSFGHTGPVELDYAHHKVVCFKDELDFIGSCCGSGFIHAYKKTLVSYFTKAYHKNFNVKNLTAWEKAIHIITTYNESFLGFMPQDMIQWIMTNPNEFTVIYDDLDDEDFITIFINRDSISLDLAMQSVAFKTVSGVKFISEGIVKELFAEFYYNDEYSMLFDAEEDSGLRRHVLLIDPSKDFKVAAQKLRELHRQVDYIDYANIPMAANYITISEAIDRIVKRDTKTEE